MLNRRAVDLALIAGLALGCKIADRTKWDRKSYCYPDLPKNYQISQYREPIGQGGHFESPRGGSSRRIRIRRIHLEEDAGKSVHVPGGCTLVDLNRAGTPLLEIVTEPNLVGAEETHTFCVELRRLVVYLGVSDAIMQRGQMRFEPNVNLHIEQNGTTHRTPITEVKNLNSFRAVRRAVAYEIDRQAKRWRSDPTYVLGNAPNENRGWNDELGITEFQRSKESAQDYRYFPEPDLVPLEFDNAWIERARGEVGELPLARRARLAGQHGLTQRDADTIVSDRASADLFESTIARGAPPAIAGKQFLNTWLPLARRLDTTVGRLGIDAVRMAELAIMVEAGALSSSAADLIAERMLASDKPTGVLANEMGLGQVRDTDAVAEWVEQAFQHNAKALGEAITNPKRMPKIVAFLRGQVMRASDGRADPVLAGKLIEQHLARILDGERKNSPRGTADPPPSP